MPHLQSLFNAAVGEEGGDALVSPGVARVATLFVEAGMAVTEAEVSRLFAEHEWDAAQSFQWEALRDLAVECGFEGGSAEESEESAGLTDTIAERICQ